MLDLVITAVCSLKAMVVNKTIRVTLEVGSASLLWYDYMILSLNPIKKGHKRAFSFRIIAT